MKIVLAATLTLVWGLKLISALNVRLALGSNQYEGNVEIFDHGTWGYICDDDWDDQDAQVICRMLGYNTSGALAYNNSHFSNGILLDNVSCSGSEESIQQCPHNGWIAQSCPIWDTRARVDCGIDVRLVGGYTEYEGIVEVFYNGIWRIICNNGTTWSIKEAKVVCRMLGFGSHSASAYCCTYPHFIMDDVTCTGEEDSIENCTFERWHNCNYDYREIAGVRCADVSLPISYSLIGVLAGTGFIIIVSVSLIVCFCYRWYKAKALLRQSLNSGESAYEGIYRTPSSNYTAIDDQQMDDVLNACELDIPVKEGNISDDKDLGSACLPTEMDVIYINVESNTSAETEL